MNPGLTRALKHPLFVEKVGGTLHVAIGASYETCFEKDPRDPAARARLEELAARLKRPLGTVKTWVRRSLLQLKACLEGGMT